MPASRRYFKKHLTNEQTQQLLARIDGSALATDIPLGTKVDHDCSVVFFDLCNFTNISWSLSSDKILDILQDLFRVVSACVAQHQGMIDKYPGDGVVAFFPRYFSDTTDEIVEYTLDCSAEVMFWFYDKMRWRYTMPKESHSLHLAVGIAAGTISIAHVGSAYHSELVLLGDQVNCASKCQQVASEKEIVIGQEAAKRVRNIYSSCFATGPATDIVYTKSNDRYLSYRFDWENLAAESSWIDKAIR